MNRREAMQALAGLASARWAAEGWDPEEIDGWDQVGGGAIRLRDFTADLVLARAEGPVSGVELTEGELTDGEVAVWYNSAGVDLDIEGDGERMHGSALAQLTPDGARDVAVALYMAAEELERRGTE